MGDQLTAKGVLESPNNVLELDRIHFTKHPSYPHRTPTSSLMSVKQASSNFQSLRDICGPISVDNQRSPGVDGRTSAGEGILKADVALLWVTLENRSQIRRAVQQFRKRD